MNEGESFVVEAALESSGRHGNASALGEPLSICVADAARLAVTSLTLVSLHFMYYNFCRTHQSLTIKNDDGTTTKRTPAMAAGIAKYPWSLTQLAQLLD
jgi:hypothetical protein